VATLLPILPISANSVPPPPPRDTEAPRPTRRIEDGVYLVFGARNAAVYDLAKGEVHWIEREALEAGPATISHLGSRLPESVKRALARLREAPIEPLPVERTDRLRFLWIELTDGCNLACGHCYASSGGAHRTLVSTAGYRKLLDEAALAGCELVQFTGGEPLLHPDLLALVDHARGRKLGVEVYTNLALMTDELARELRSREVALATSFYSDRAEDHEAVTRVPGSFDATVASIRRVLALRMTLRVGVVLQEGGKERRAETLAFLRGLGVREDLIRFDEVRPEGRGTERAAPASMPSQRDSCGHEPQRAYSRALSVEHGQVKAGNCWGGELDVTAKGEVVPCIFERKLVVGHVDEGLGAIAAGARARSIWNVKLESCRVCRDCEFRYSCFDCRFMAWRATGDLYAKPPACRYDPYTGRHGEEEALTTAPRRRKDLVLEDVEDGMVALDERRGEAHALNATSAAVFDLLDGKRDLESIAGIVAEATGAPLARVLQDTKKAVEEFRARGLLEA